MDNTTRILINTLAQYFRTGINVVLTLYATRLVLEALGSSQYGIYTLVGGIVSMLSFFTNALTQTTQRYLSYNSATNDINIQKSYFLNSVVIHGAIGLVLVIILLSISPFLFSGFLNIAPEFLSNAKTVFWTIIAMLFIAMMTSPYRAVLISHENIVYLSFIDIIDGILKLLIAYMLFKFSGNRLVWYAFLLLGVSVFNFVAIGIYSLFRYRESRIKGFRELDKRKIKELTSFAGWTLYGMLCLFGRIQGLAVVLNKFFNTVVNASYGIALQVNSAIGAVSGALQTAISPQLIKAEGDSNHEKMIEISVVSCKISFFLISILGIPLIFNINYILNLWLGDIPAYATYLCNILIISNIIDQLSVGFNTSLNAVGKIKYNHLIVNTLKLLTVGVVYGLLRIGIDLKWAMLAYIVIELFGSIIRIKLCAKYTSLNVEDYIRRLVARMLVPTLIICMSYYLLDNIYSSFISFLGVILSVSILYMITTFYIGLTPSERTIIISLVKKFK